MTNEELCALIQAGERDRLGELWEQVEKFVSMMAGRRARQIGGFGGVTAEDLYQSGFLAVVAAVDSYDSLSLGGCPWPLKRLLRGLPGSERQSGICWTIRLTWTRPFPGPMIC